VWLWRWCHPVLIVVGYIATRLPYGFYVCRGDRHRDCGRPQDQHLDGSSHTRFPTAPIDPAEDPASNQFDPGQWELTARDTALSLEHWTIGLALVSIAVTGGLTVKRRYWPQAADAVHRRRRRRRPTTDAGDRYPNADRSPVRRSGYTQDGGSCCTRFASLPITV
jgi:hypothetical protein